jgi:hypothetical protein
MVKLVDKHKLIQEKRLTQVELDCKIIRTDINTIKNNHLAHIESTIGSLDRKIDKLETRVWAILFGIVMLGLTNIIATIIGN